MTSNDRARTEADFSRLRADAIELGAATWVYRPNFPEGSPEVWNRNEDGSLMCDLIVAALEDSAALWFATEVVSAFGRGEIDTVHDNLHALAADHADWSEATFGATAERGPVGPLRHLEKEVAEALAQPYDAAEYADLLLLVLDASRRAGLSSRALVTAARAKLDVNKARDWPAAAPDQPVEHVATDADVYWIEDEEFGVSSLQEVADWVADWGEMIGPDDPETTVTVRRAAYLPTLDVSVRLDATGRGVVSAVSVRAPGGAADAPCEGAQ